MGWSRNFPIARKPHRCELCERIIEIGERYLRGAGFEDGTAWTWKECAHCTAIQTTYDISDVDGQYNGEYFYEWAHSGGQQDLEDCRAMAGYRKQWRTKAGNLWPMPAKERK